MFRIVKLTQKFFYYLKFLNYESCYKPDSFGKIACRMCGCMFKYGQGINRHATICKKKFNDKNVYFEV